ncbi:MAG: ABC transporter permease [Acetivibrionales bacterium]
MKRREFFQTYGIIIVLIALVAFFSIFTNSFLSVKNMFNILRQVSIMGIIAVGMTIVMLTGGIDLSVGSLLAVTGVVGSSLMVSLNWSPLPAIIAAIIASTIIGTITGLIVEKIDMPPLITTLGMMTIARGIAFIITNGLPVYGLPESVAILGQGYIWVIPIPVIFMLVIFLIGSFILNKTYFGRYFYALGGNEEATRLAGVNISRIKICIYALSAFLTGIAGVILMSRINSGQPSAGTGTELDVVTAVVLGGVSMSGGEGKLSGVLTGTLIIGVLSNGLIIMNVGEYYQMVVKGLVLILAVGFDRVSKRNRVKKSKQSKGIAPAVSAK